MKNTPGDIIILHMCTKNYDQKNGFIRNTMLFKNFRRHNLVKKQLQYTYYQYFASKTNQTMKFGQVIEYNKRNIFIQKSFR